MLHIVQERHLVVHYTMCEIFPLSNTICVTFTLSCIVCIYPLSLVICVIFTLPLLFLYCVRIIHSPVLCVWCLFSVWNNLYDIHLVFGIHSLNVARLSCSNWYDICSLSCSIISGRVHLEANDCKSVACTSEVHVFQSLVRLFLVLFSSCHVQHTFNICLSVQWCFVNEIANPWNYSQWPPAYIVLLI